jgi:hypothetical protein
MLLKTNPKESSRKTAEFGVDGERFSFQAFAAASG